MKPRLQIWGVIDTLAHGQTVKGAVVAELAGKDIFEQHSLDHEVDPDSGEVTFFLDVRFNTDIDRNTVRDWVQAQVAEHPTVKTWFSFLKVWWHNCPHEEVAPTIDCFDGYKVWQKGEAWPAGG